MAIQQGRRFYRYIEKNYKVLSGLAEVVDGRQWCKTELADVLRIIFVGAVNGYGSINRIAQNLRGKSASFNFMGRRARPSADAIAYALTKMPDADGLRAVMAQIARRAKRNKTVSAGDQGITCAVDGIEVFSSRARCCDECLERTITVNGKEETEYYHRVVVCSIVMEETHLILDLEMTRKGEGEVTTAKRLLERVMLQHRRYFNYLTFDAIYANRGIISLAQRYGKGVVIVLKHNCEDLLQDAEQLLPMSSLTITEHNDTKRYLREVEGLDNWEPTVATLRVVESQEVKTETHLVGKTESQVIVRRTWVWLTTIPASERSADEIATIGHRRWKIENRAFNELANLWHAKHCYCKEPRAIEAMLFILAIAHTLFDLFYLRRLKPETRALYSKLALRLDCLAHFDTVAAFASG